MTKGYRLFHSRCPTRSRARVRLSLCVLIMGANLELMTSASSAATSPAAPVEMTTAASGFFYHTDDLYNVMAITDDTGDVADAGNERQGAPGDTRDDVGRAHEDAPAKYEEGFEERAFVCS